MFCVMSPYEWTSSVISLGALLATIYFGYVVSKLSKKSNEISLAALNFEKQKEKDKKDLDKRSRQLTEPGLTEKETIQKNAETVFEKLNE